MDNIADFRVAIIGLGLIGGSLAYAMRGFKNAQIVGCDMNEKTRNMALKTGAVNMAYEKAGDAIENSDLVIICTYPEDIPKIVSENFGRFKASAVLTDVCGVKTNISKKIKEALPEAVDYVGSHPMAGKEVDGFSNASDELFWMTGFIICPISNSKTESIELIKELAKYIGATRIAINTPDEHDEIIAYTSDLMHISAAALCLKPHPKMNTAYTAGAFRDCTRIAQINPDLWCELFLENAENTINEIDGFVDSLGQLRDVIANKDEKALHELLTKVRENKRLMQNKTAKI
ncbi:MAG: prephenate dehydrogenase [Oscillospiraceae bacterium]